MFSNQYPIGTFVKYHWDDKNRFIFLILRNKKDRDKGQSPNTYFVYDFRHKAYSFIFKTSVVKL